MPVSHTADFAYTGSLQTYTISTSGTYELFSAGASGGANGMTLGGYGATVQGYIHLVSGTQLQVVVGGEGGSGGAGGGGGGSFVYYSSGSSPVLLEAAGGGGGEGFGTPVMGQAGLNGTDGTGGSPGSGGVNGFGGTGGGDVSFPDGGGGGAGWLGSGGEGFNADSINGGMGGSSLGGGFAGGAATVGFGGYGGGGSGSAYGSGGGGGGYSGGGGGGTWSMGFGGGGGGSYIINSATSPVLTTGANTTSTDGYVWLSLVSPDSVPSTDTITVGGQILSKQSVSNGTTLTTNNASITMHGNLSAQGGTAQNNPLSTQNTSQTTAGAVVTLPTLMSVKTQKIMGLLGAVTAEMAESMANGVSGSATDSTKIAGSSMIAPPDSDQAVESIAPVSDVPMEAIAYPVYGYNYFYLSDFQGSSNFRVTSQTGNLLTTNLLELINNNGGNQNVDIAGYQGIVVATPGVNVTGLTVNNYLGTFGGGSYTFGAGNQKLFLMGPNSSIAGGGGVDTVRFLGVGQGGANITQQGSEVQIWSDWLDTGSGVTYMHNVARAQFDDGSVAFDTGVGQNAGQVFRLYEAAFHRVGDQQGIGYWLSQLDNGTSLNTIANQFLSSQEFINLYGSSPSNNQFITALYNNVLGRAPDAAGLNYWLSTGLNKAQLLIEFAESPEGVAHVSGQMAQGVQYQQWVQ